MRTNKCRRVDDPQEGTSQDIPTNSVFEPLIARFSPIPGFAMEPRAGTPINLPPRDGAVTPFHVPFDLPPIENTVPLEVEPEPTVEASKVVEVQIPEKVNLLLRFYSGLDEFVQDELEHRLGIKKNVSVRGGGIFLFNFDMERIPFSSMRKMRFLTRIYNVAALVLDDGTHSDYVFLNLLLNEADLELKVRETFAIREKYTGVPIPPEEEWNFSFDVDFLLSPESRRFRTMARKSDAYVLVVSFIKQKNWKWKLSLNSPGTPKKNYIHICFTFFDDISIVGMSLHFYPETMMTSPLCKVPSSINLAMASMTSCEPGMITLEIDNGNPAVTHQILTFTLVIPFVMTQTESAQREGYLKRASFWTFYPRKHYDIVEANCLHGLFNSVDRVFTQIPYRGYPKSLMFDRKFHESVFYFHEKCRVGSLLVTMHDARDLPELDVFCSSDFPRTHLVRRLVIRVRPRTAIISVFSLDEAPEPRPEMRQLVRYDPPTRPRGPPIYELLQLLVS